MKPFVVAISGEKDHGKSTLAHLVAEKITKQFCIETHVEHLALPMYQMMAIFTGDLDFVRNPEDVKLRTYEFENGTWTGTGLPQDIAQRYGREYFGGGTWANLWKKRVMVHPQESIVFVPDSRMPNERSFCDLGIWISAPGVVTKQNTNHETERHLHVMKEQAAIHVVRHGADYNPVLQDIASDIVIRYSQRNLA